MQKAPLPTNVASSTPPLLKSRRQARLTAGLVATVVFLTAIAPLATDMYVPAFPPVVGELSTTAHRFS
jgi:DHA1 family bicyclomycin/chloramphenicol resistance-like MFS transporter